MLKNHTILSLLFICLTIQAAQSLQQCGAGSVKCANQCDSPAYIEGCLSYKSRTQCDVCEYNYIKKNGLCSFQPSSLSKCCLQFDSNGECKLCALGLYLNPADKECIDVKIPGCLQKTSAGCINCAKQFYLTNGTCIPRINGCSEYLKSGSGNFCSKCDDGFDLIKGQCAGSQWKNRQEKECIFPFRLSKQKGVCHVPNCKSAFEWGCIECSQDFDLNKNGDCIPRKIPGCIDYASQNECKICEDSLYQLFKGVCYPYGCLELNKNLQCVNCNSRLGFVLEQGKCVIPFCSYAGKNGCNVCQQRRTWITNQCVLQDQLDQTVCVACPQTHYLNTRNECERRQQGCATYKFNICISCSINYVLESVTKKCIRKTPGCIYNQKAQCTSCENQYVYSQKDKQCFIIGCKTYSQNGFCSQCESIFKLTFQKFCSIDNCLQVNEKGCQKCVENYQVNNQSSCSPYDPHCIARNVFGKCIGCHDGYYVDSTSTCKPSTLGCNYVDGRCTSCKTPFIYQRQTSTCFIDGCKQYFFGGCEICQETYGLRYNSCKLPHCLISNNGRCLECDPDYIMRTRTNQCINKDEFCYEYNKEGECIECAPKYFMSKLQHKCLARQPGCIYDNQDRCSKCISPFKQVLGSDKCYISGCLEHTLDNCKQCRYPFESTDKKFCSIKNCLANNDDQCIECFGGYLLENGLCTTGDSNCVQYNFKSGECLKCKQGYNIVKNKCQYEDAHCQTFTPKGHCSNCQRLYFLNPLKQCEVRDSNCQQYTNGYCTKCKPYFYYFNSLCYQYSKGCALQSSIDRCDKCEDGFKLESGKCNKNITKLNWNSIEMDWSSSSDAKTKQQLQQTFTVGKSNKINLQATLKTGYGKLFYSSDVQSTKSCSISDQGNGWQPRTQINEFVGAQVKTKETFYAVDIQCLVNNKMTSFTLQYLDSNTTSVFRKGSVYDLVCEAPGVIKTIYFTPVQAFAVRIRVRRGLPNIKVEFYYNNRNYKLVEVSQNETIIQQTIRQTVEAAHQLLSNSCKDKDLCWFGLQICEPRAINGFVIENNDNAKGRITSVFVDYSIDGIEFTCYDECRRISVTDGNVRLNKPVFSSKMRVHVAQYEGEPKIKVKFDYN